MEYKTVTASDTELALITVWALIITIDQTVNGYTITSRNRDYSNGYSTKGGGIGSFIGLSKEPLTDPADQLSSSSSYYPSNSQRYPVLTTNSHSNPTTSYSSAAYSEGIQSNGYLAQSPNTPETSNNIASPYTNDIHASSDITPTGYSMTSGSTDGGYSSNSGHMTAGLSEYSSSQRNSVTGLSANDHTAAVEYNAPSSSAYSASASPLKNYAIPAPKTPAYTTSSHSHINSPFVSDHKLISSGHSRFPGGSNSISYPNNHLNSYPGNRHSIAGYSPGSAHSSHKSYSDGPRFSSSLVSYLSPHSGNGANNYISNSAALPLRSGILPYSKLGASTNINPTYAKGPGSFYPGPGGFSKSGNKYIIIKDNPGSHATLMHPSELNYSSRMFPGITGLKMKSANLFASGQYPSSNHFASMVHLSSGYPGASSGHHSAGPPSSYFAYQ